MPRQGRTPNRRTGARRAQPQRLRLFRSDRLERLTVMTPRAFAATWGLLLPLVAWAGSGAASLPAWFALVALGLVGWSLFEYAMHRFLFHLEPRSAFGRRLGFIMHGNHHEDPGDPHRSMMPLAVSLPWSAAIWAGCALAFGPAGTVAFLGFAIGYVAYDSIHYACHQLPVKGRLLRALRRHHLRHHFGREEGHYAITAIWWDRVFGTMVAGKAASGIMQVRT
ncbi:sterol desaturase family protein [Sphingomonas bacterium]|uniref:sterol desaturase family protein n=1 Tax=Sphingomonas bacterium TaxID=1895847 RepID=UPI00157547C3|nr:sterol desaturase family protein [Sphingomonas bacterium]